MDITTVFGTVVGGSNPSGSTKQLWVVKRVLPEGFERRSAAARVGVARFFSRKILVTESSNMKILKYKTMIIFPIFMSIISIVFSMGYCYIEDSKGISNIDKNNYFCKIIDKL